MISELVEIVNEMKGIADKLSDNTNSEEALRLLKEKKETLGCIGIYLYIENLKKVADQYDTPLEFFVKGYAPLRSRLQESNLNLEKEIISSRKELENLSGAEKTWLGVKILVEEEKVEYKNKIFDNYYNILSLEKKV